MTFLTELLQRPPITWWDLLDIAIVSVLIYELLKLIRGTRAVQMAIGIAFIAGLFYVSRGFQLETVNWLIRNIVGYVVFAAIVLFQADIRRALVHLGRAPCSGASTAGQADEETIEELVVAASALASKQHRRDHRGRAVRSACATTSRAASRSTRSSPTTCW